MILDALLSFTNPTAGDLITAAQTTFPFSNDLDWGISGLPPSATSPTGQPFRDMGIGDDPSLKLMVEVTTAFAGGTNLFLILQGAPDNGSGGEGSFSTWWTSNTFTTAQLLQGVRLIDIDFPRPPAGIALPRFSRLCYTSTGTYTAGAIRAFVVGDRIDQIYNGTNNSVLGGYPPGITIPN